MRYCAPFACHSLLYVHWVDELTQELQHPSPCADFSLLTNLPFTGSPQMALLLSPIFKYKRPPGTTSVCVCVCVCVCICHTAACRGLSHSTKTSLPFSMQVCFHHKEPPPSNNGECDRVGGKPRPKYRLFTQGRFVLEKKKLLWRSFISMHKTLFSFAKMVSHLARSPRWLCVRIPVGRS